MATAAAGPTAECLVIDAPNGETVRIHLEKQQYRLGRAPDNDLAFPADQKLSREHLILERRQGCWTLRDLQSRNGTVLNGQCISEPTPLTHGDRITAGHLVLCYDTRGEFAHAKLKDVQFVNQELTTAKHTVALDLKSALADAHSTGRPTLHDSHLGALVQAVRALAGQGALDRLFELVLNSSLDAVKASRGIVMTKESGGELAIRAVRGDKFRISNTVREMVMTEGQSLLVRDARLYKDFASRTSIIAEEVRSILAVPLQTDERVIGLLYLDSSNIVRDFTVEDLNLVTVLANIAAIRIEHARLIREEESRKLLDRDLERAAEIQRRLLPSHAPEISGFDLAGYNAPCRTVGGDYYDFLTYSDGRVAILIGDVSGKGFGAALLMSSLQARAQVFFDDPKDLAIQLSHLNRSVACNCPGNSFITFFIGILNPANGEVVYCNAGHNPPLLINREGRVETLETTGIPLGISINATYEEKTFRLGHGDVLILFSDGVTEASSPVDDNEFGEDRLISVVKRERGLSSGRLVERIRAELQSFSQAGAASDDVTLVLAQRD